MKKSLLITAVLLCCVLLLAGCGCEHEWVEANCVNPMTCSLCEETEGAPLGHSWLAATCTEPKSCENCDATEGEAKGHQWEDATCVVPKKCAVCHETEGETLSHQWEEATTEAPKTCVNCQATEGSKIDVDPRFTTESTKELYGKWTCDVVLTGEMMGTEGYLDEMACTLSYEFTRTGEMKVDVEVHDRFAFLQAVKDASIDAIYATFEEMGYSRSDTDQAIYDSYGMTTEEYVDTAVESMDMDELFGAFAADAVYYVGAKELYISDSWYGEFTSSAYTIDGDTLIIEDDVLEEGGEPLVWKRVAE